MSPAGPVRRSTPEGRAVERYEMELLTRLGLDRRATPEEIEEAHDAVARFLVAAPRSLRTWAHVQAAAADEAFALLNDPAALVSSAALAKPAVRPAVVPGGPATPPARREDALPEEAPEEAPEQALEEAPEGPAEDYDSLFAAVTPSAHRDQRGPARVQPDRLPTSVGPRAPAPRSSWLSRRTTIAGVAIVGVVIVAAVGLKLVPGAPTATPLPSGAAAQAALEATVAPLMQRISADPKDTTALMSLGDAYFLAGQYEVAATWYGKLLAVTPNDARALLAKGAAEFNFGDFDAAEAAWKQVLVLDADSVEAHYDLGFLYLRRQPPDMVGVRREWGEVVRLDPGSEVAKTVAAHLDALESPAPTGSPGPVSSSLPSPAASPATSPAASPVASPSAQP
jgi:tetratricopeptide (TPR) repeat protein